eukprot:PhM_4_TR1754/c0_g1_i1/m.98444
MQFLNRRRKEAPKQSSSESRPSQRKGNYPYNAPLKVGIFVSDTQDGKPLETSSVDVGVCMARTSTSVRIAYKMLPPRSAADWASVRDSAALWFPLSECGHVEKFSVRLLCGSEDVAGEILQDATLSRDSIVYYYVVRDIGKHFAKNGIVGWEVRYTVKNVTNKKGEVCFALPLSVLPKSPARLHMDVHMDEPIRHVRCPNRPNSTMALLDGNKAAVSFPGVEDGSAPLVLSQYLLVVQVELGEPIVPQCADPITILILVSAIGLFIFFVLTKDLPN